MPAAGALFPPTRKSFPPSAPGGRLTGGNPHHRNRTQSPEHPAGLLQPPMSGETAFADRTIVTVVTTGRLGKNTQSGIC